MLAFTALADPTRFRIIEMLGAHGALTAGSISEQFSITAPAISQHLRILKKARLVEVTAQAQKRIYSLNPKGIDEVEHWVTTMKDQWGSHFDALEKLLKTEEPSMSQEFEFTISRIFDAPRERVWAAWTDEKQLQQWFGPKGCPIADSHLDLREGGGYHYSMAIPASVKIWGKWTFLTIKRPSELVFTVSFSEESGKTITRNPWSTTWPLEMLSTVTFTEKNGKTEVKLTGKAHKATDLEAKTFEEGAPGMTQGWTGTFDQLQDYLAKQ